MSEYLLTFLKDIGILCLSVCLGNPKRDTVSGSGRERDWWMATRSIFVNLILLPKLTIDLFLVTWSYDTLDIACVLEKGWI